MPIEARMAGMFAGFLIAAAYGWAVGRGRAMRLPGRAMTLTLVGFIALVGVDGVNAFLFDLRRRVVAVPGIVIGRAGRSDSHRNDWDYRAGCRFAAREPRRPPGRFDPA